MRILNLDGNYFVEPFKRMGHDVLWLGPLQGSDVRLSRTLSLNDLLKLFDEKSFFPDLIVWNDICRPPSVVGIESLPAITVGYSIDQYCNPWHTPYSAAFDLMLLAQKDYMQGFLEAGLGNKLEWAPLFTNSIRDKDMGLERDIPVSFVGTVEGSINSHRKAFLMDFKKKHPLFIMQGKYGPIFNRSQIILNQSAVGELNFRLFEGMGCGAAMLTEETTNGLRDLFTEGEDILLYPRDNPKAAAEVAANALRDPEKLAQIARNGRRNVVANHSSTIRAKHIIQRARELAGQGATWRKSHPKVVARNLATTYLMLAVDTENQLPKEQRDFFTMLGQQMLEESKR